MPHFLTQAAYTEQAWQSLVSNPQNRLDAIRPVIEKLGGRVVNAYFAFGDYDFVLITELPDNVSAAALAIAASAGGACKPVERRLPPGIALQRAGEPRRRNLAKFAAYAANVNHGASQHDWDALLF